MRYQRPFLPIMCVVVGCSGGFLEPSTSISSPSTTSVEVVGSTSTPGDTSTTSGSIDVCATTDVSSVPIAEPAFEGVPLWDFYPEVDQHRVSPLTSATVAGGMVYVGASDVAGGDEGSLHALHVDGSVAWSFRHGGHTPSTPVVRDGVVFVGSEDHNLYAIGAESGEELWRFATNGHVRTRPAVADDAVMITGQDGLLYVLDVETGELRWSQQVAQPVSDVRSLGAQPPSPAVDRDSAIVAATADGRNWSLSAYELTDGGLRWRTAVEQQVFRSPTAGSGMVFLPAGDLFGIEAESGETLWSCRAEGNFLSEPFLTPSAVYATSSDGSVYALDPMTGRLLWRTDTEVAGLSSLTVEDDVIYVHSTDGRLLALTSQGDVLSTYDVGAEINGKPQGVAAGVVYVVTMNRHLYAIDMSP